MTKQNENYLKKKNKELQEMLIHANKMSLLGEMSAFMAHELRGSLSAISMSVNLLWNSFHKGNKAFDCLKYYNIFSEELRRSDEVIENLLGLSRKSICKKELVDVELLINNIIAFKYKVFCLASIEVKTSFAGIPKIKANKDSMKTVFFNLVGNAIQAMEKKGGFFEVYTSQEKGFVTIEIADTGDGIPKNNSHRIWEPFFTTKGDKGTGIGLYLTRMQVEKHGGTIELNTERRKGASFMVKLPITGEDVD